MRKLLISSTLLLLGCASGRLNVDSSPKQSDVYVKAAGGNKYVSFGKTPLSEIVSEVINRVGGERTIVVETRKLGYLPKSVLVTDVDSLSDIKLNLEMSSIESFLAGKDPSMSDAQKAILVEISEKQTMETNKMVDEIFEAQRLVQVGRLGDAEAKLKLIEKEFPNLSSIYEIRGGIAIMQKDFPKALDEYQKAARANPDNIEILNVKKYLERKLASGSSGPLEDQQ